MEEEENEEEEQNEEGDGDDYAERTPPWRGQSVHMDHGGPIFADASEARRNLAED